MVNRPSVPEIITVNSEDLQTQIRDLLPSQNGFGSELQASNVITPIIDLTEAAQGSTTPQLLQTAWGFETELDVTRATTATIISSTGFWQVGLTASWGAGGSTGSFIFIDDGASTKKIWYGATIGSGAQTVTVKDQFIVFLRAGDSMKVTCDTADEIAIWYKQIASLDGTLTVPLGFSPT
jgi:hypothetical protein